MPATPEEPEPTPSDVGSDEEGPAPTPFDHPLFLPALLLAFSLWFGYDGFLNDDPDMMEHQTFNRVGFGIWVALLAYYGYRGLREMREHEDGPRHPPTE